ncbi:GAF domain-containing protein [Mycobacterium sp. MMS18-G62]
MHQQLDELLAARDQMELLLRVIVQIGSDLDLDATLDRIVTAARELTGARYGAVAVRTPEGTLTSFVNEGMDVDTVRLIGHLPVGKGLLGVKLDSSDVLRLDDLTAHPAAGGFPEHHPKMRAFLGVPITIRNTVFGSLYVADDRESKSFTPSDEIGARALATAAAVAIDNAQLYERMRASAKWTNASREITTALLSGADPQLRPLKLIAERARELTEAEQAIVLVPADADEPAAEVDTLVVSTAVGLYAEEVTGQRVPVDDSTSGEVFRSGTPLITESFRYPIQAFTDVGERPAIVMPLRANDTVVGVIAVARNTQQPPFEPMYLDLVSDFASHAALALTLAQSRETARELTILADRERIAHDLHDHVIQRLFAAGLDLQGTAARARSPEVTNRLNRTIDELQSTIEDIRSAIFGLQNPPGVGDDLGRRIRDLVADLTENRDISTTLHMSGPTSAVASDIAEHAEAVTTEAISNAVRHSGASRLIVELAVGDQLVIDITDNGCGIPADNMRHSGLANLHRRAEAVGGTCQITTPPQGGTRIRWAAPVIEP